MVKHIDPSVSQNILEVGGGTGAITKILLKKVADHPIDVVETLPGFAKILHNRFENRQNVTIHCRDIRDFHPPKKYDVIISSLPFNSLGPEAVDEIVKHLLFLSKPKAMWAFFEYLGVSMFVPYLYRKNSRENFYRSRKIVNDLAERYQFETESVYLNFPPARVRFLRIHK